MNTLEIVIVILVISVVVLLVLYLKNKSLLQTTLGQKSKLEYENNHISSLNEELRSSNTKFLGLQEELSNIKSQFQYTLKIYEDTLHQKEELLQEKNILLEKNKTLQEYEYEVKNIRQQLKDTVEALENATKNVERLKISNQELETDLKIMQEKNQVLQENMRIQKEEFDRTNTRIQNEIKHLSQQIFQENTEKLSLKNQEQIAKALDPLKEQIQQFNTKLESQHKEQILFSNTLSSKIKDLVAQTDHASKIAENLANALKGDTKLQGDWGEMILENILQHAGLEENREYFIQPNYKNESEQNIRPDIVIQLPGERKVVIDSKVSLTAYERFCNETDDTLAAKWMEEHLRSIRNHIQILSQKDYSQIPGSLDFVMLFIPIESAYVLALKHDSQLWNMAYKNKIILMSPTNIIAAIKLIADLWNRERQYKGSLKIAELAEKMHTKLSNFINQFDDIGIQIQRSHQQFINAQKLLITGKGNLSNQLNELKQMGIKSKHPIKNEVYFIDEQVDENLTD